MAVIGATAGAFCATRSPEYQRELYMQNRIFGGDKVNSESHRAGP